MPFYPHVIIYQQLFEAPFVPLIALSYDTTVCPDFAPDRRGGLNAPRQQYFAMDPLPRVSTSYDLSFNPDFAPDRRGGLWAPYQQAFTFDTDPVVSFSWFRMLTDPSRAKPWLLTAQQQAFTFDTDPVVSFSFFNWLSEPVRKSLSVAEHKYEFSAYFTPAAAFTTFWYSPFSEPIRTKAALLAAQQQTTALNPLPLVSFSYFNGLSDPVRVPPRLATGANQDFAYGSFNPIIPSFGYFNALSDPVRRKLIAEHRYEFSANFTPAPTTTIGFFNALSVPIQFSTKWTTGDATSDFVAVEATTPTGWYSQWLDPRRGPSLRQEWTTPVFPIAQFLQWFAPLADPVQNRMPWKTGDNSYGFANVQAAVPTIDSWGQPWIGFPGLRRGVPFQQALAFTPFVVTTPAVVTGWFTPFSDPVKTSWTTGDTSYGFAAVAAATPQLGFFNWLSEPVRQLRGLQAYQQKDFHYGTISPVAPSFGYFNALSEPVRQKAGLQTPLQSFIAYARPPIVPFSYFNWLTEPVRSPARLQAGANRDFAYGSINPVVSFAYYNWLTEPVRTKAALQASQQQTFAYGSFNPIIPSFGYFNAFSEPVRQKVGLQARLQSTTTFGQVPIIPSFGYFNSLALPNVLFTKRMPLNTPAFTKPEFTPAFVAATMNMNAVERGDFFFAILASFGLPLKALVSIDTFHPSLRLGVGPGVATNSPQANISGITSPVGGRVAIALTPGPGGPGSGGGFSPDAFDPGAFNT